MDPRYLNESGSEGSSWILPHGNPPLVFCWAESCPIRIAVTQATLMIVRLALFIHSPDFV